MQWLRLPVAVFAFVHGLGHLIWFVGAWFPRTRMVDDRPWILPGDVMITGPVGKLLGVVALAALGGFAAAAWALFAREEWWQTAMIASCLVSLVAVVPWWRSSPGTTSLNATLGDVGLLIVALLPTADDLVAAA